MSTKEQVVRGIENLNETELRQVVEFLAFLKFRARTQFKPFFDLTQIAEFYAEFADEDRQLAETGVDDYYHGLLAEDTL